MGRVWAAHDLLLDRRVAIKQVDFPPGMPAAEVDLIAQRTMREARAVASVSDPHVVIIFDMLSLPHGPAIVMELLSARSLAEIIASGGPLSESQAATVGLSVSSGLLAAHAVGIVHRDVKPGNVLICDDGRVKLTDFGIARSTGEQTITATGLLLGSPAYISPEVAAGHPADPRSDAWGLGALLFTCMQGVPPFDRGAPLATLTAVVQDPVPPHPRSGRLGGVIRGLLVKDAGTRMSVGTAHQVLLRIADGTGRLVTHGSPGPVSAGAARSSAASGPSAAAATSGAARSAAASGPSAAAATSGAVTSGAAPGAAGSGAAGRDVSTHAPWQPPVPPARTAGPVAHRIHAGQESSTWSAQPAAVPPPPWAGAGASSLRPLPVRAPSRTSAQKVALASLALLIAVAAAAAGFLAIRAIAHLQAGVPLLPFSW